MKAKIAYAIRETKAPGETESALVPVVVDRRPPVSLTKVVEDAIDRALIVGPKAPAAEEIARGIADQTYKEFCDGHSVRFGEYFYGRPYLDGTCGPNGNLTKGANSVNVRLYKGEDFNLALSDFAFSFEGAADEPRIGWLLPTGSSEAPERNVLEAGKPVSVFGRFLKLDGDTAKVEFAEVGGVAKVEVESFTAAGPEVLSFAWPAALVVGKSYAVTAYRTQEDGIVRTSNVKRVTVKAGAGPAEPPEITRVQSDNEPDGTVNIGGAFLEVSGQNILDATEVKLYNSHGTLLDTSPMERHEERADTIRSTRSVTVEYTPEGGVETGSLTVTTAGGTDSHEVSLLSH